MAHMLSPLCCYLARWDFLPTCETVNILLSDRSPHEQLLLSQVVSNSETTFSTLDETMDKVSIHLKVLFLQKVAGDRCYLI